MIRAALLAAVLLLALPGAARALEPPPTIHDFSAFPQPGATYDTAGSQCGPDVVGSGGFDGGAYLVALCGGAFYVSFPRPQAVVQIHLRAGAPIPTASEEVRLTACGASFCDPDTVDRAVLTPAPRDWVPVTLRDPGGRATIESLVVRAGRILHLDDLGFSVSGSQPDTELTQVPPAVTAATEATLAYRANQPAATFACTLDGAAVACAPPAMTLSGLLPGVHTVTVAARDRWGQVDATPASTTWTVAAPPPRVPEALPPALGDADADGVPDGADTCPLDADPDQADGDGDGIGTACELLEPGDRPPVAGVSAVVRLVSGEVFVRLPATAPAAFARSLRAPFQEQGFVPLKGVASVPVGSVLDTRRGRLAMTSAANTLPPGRAQRRTQVATFAAGIFRLRQARARARRASRRSIPTDAVLLSPPGAERACRSSARTRPSKGIVRALSVSGKGFHRTVAAASLTTARDATFITTDRCDGTLTEVGRGRVSVVDRARRRTVSVRAGRGYLARARLFAAKKGRARPAR